MAKALLSLSKPLVSESSSESESARVRDLGEQILIFKVSMVGREEEDGPVDCTCTTMDVMVVSVAVVAFQRDG